MGNWLLFWGWRDIKKKKILSNVCLSASELVLHLTGVIHLSKKGSEIEAIVVNRQGIATEIFEDSEQLLWQQKKKKKKSGDFEDSVKARPSVCVSARVCMCPRQVPVRSTRIVCNVGAR